MMCVVLWHVIIFLWPYLYLYGLDLAEIILLKLCLALCSVKMTTFVMIWWKLTICTVSHYLLKTFNLHHPQSNKIEQGEVNKKWSLTSKKRVSCGHEIAAQAATPKWRAMGAQCIMVRENPGSNPGGTPNFGPFTSAHDSPWLSLSGHSFRCCISCSLLRGPGLESIS